MSDTDELYQYLITYNKLRARAEKQPDFIRFQYQMDSIREKLQERLNARNIDATVPRFHYDKVTWRPDRFGKLQKKPSWLPKLEEFKNHPLLSKLADDVDDDKDEDGTKKYDNLGRYIPGPLKASHVALTKAEVGRAHMLHASQAYHRSKDFSQAEIILSKNDFTKDYKIDKALSTEEALVLTKGEGANKQVEIAWRGTNPKNMSDIYTDINIGLGSEEGTKQMLEADELTRAVIQKYSKVDHNSGFSLGAAKASTSGRTHNIKATLFNPWMGKNYINQGPTKEIQKIIRTTEDIASANLLRSKTASNFEIKSFYPIKGQGDPISSHNLINFMKERVETEEELMSGINDDTGIKEDLARIRMNGKKLAEMTSLHRAKEHVSSNKTFSEFVKHHADGDAIDKSTMTHSDGKTLIKKNTVTAKSSMIRDWLASGGNFTREEISNIKVDVNNDLGKVNRRSGTRAAKVNKIKNARVDMTNKYKPKPIPELSNLDETIKSGLFPPPEEPTLSLEERLNALKYGTTNTTQQTKLPEVKTTGTLEEQLKRLGIEPSANDPPNKLNSRDTELRLKSIQKVNNDHHSLQKELTDTDTFKFLNEDANKRKTIIDEHINDTKVLADQVHEKVEGLSVEDNKILASNAKKVRTGATSLGAGFIAGAAANSLFENYIDKSHWLNEYARSTAEGATTGLLTAAGLSALTATPLTTAALLPEIAAGASGYLAGQLAYQGSHYLAKKLGASDTVAEGVGSGVGGTVGGAVAIGVGAVATSALTGAEIGSILGPAGLAVGAGLGLAIGLGSYIWSHFDDLF